MRQLSRITVTAAPLWRGLDYGPAVVVLAPSETRPAELPIAWQPLEQCYQIAWCAVPDGVESLDRVEDVLETLADRNIRTHLVAHTSLRDVAARIVAEFPDIVRSLVLVGPGRVSEPTGVRTRRVTAGELTSPEAVREIAAVVERGETANVRLSLPGDDRITLGRLRVEVGRR
ncbi:hypothetical protein [Actinokineospora sp. NBRC 105648]|uniref:hypothetical protein n=1 Tax=Actinokineospora sp. NBRC 105648 TaxID=3032206 RepID=UPI0024A2E46C|nr:hypothetical protein [Actinokineospora sp. NBRC 105648]GLZ39526.1 hypothetical protein Acsp05_31500 [Actinokineospora sp. NBRC 105648]